MHGSVEINLVEVTSFKELAVRTGLTPDKSGTREAKKVILEFDKEL